MYGLLSDLRVVEGASFVAGPLCCQHLRQMGAEVIRFDMIGGGPDFLRWPRAPHDGPSLYWEGLNKGKKSVAIDLSRPEGRELAVAIVTAPGEGAGLFVTNYPVDSFLSHPNLAPRRPDLITVSIMGWADGRSAVDYTVNAALGVPMMTGPAEMHDEPVNHVLPAWDIAAGNYAAFILTAAERRRARGGGGGEIRVPLGDVAMATLGHLGQIAEATLSGDRARYGNDLFGAFGRDFRCADGRRIMVVAITRRQWKALVKALDLDGEIQRLEAELGIDLAADEGLRFRHRDRLNPLIEEAVGRLRLPQLEALFRGTGICWAPYNTLCEALTDPKLISLHNPLFAEAAHSSGYSYPTPGPAAVVTGAERGAPGRAPRLGEHTEEVLAQVLGLDEAEIGRLHDAGIVAGPAGPGARYEAC